jgi:hypothetical protein
MNPMNTKKFLRHPRISPRGADSSKSISLSANSRNSPIKPQPAKSKSEQLIKQRQRRAFGILPLRRERRLLSNEALFQFQM